MKSRYENLQEKLEKRFEQKTRRKRKRMKISGKNVFQLQRLIDSTSRKKSNKRKKS